MTLVRGRTFTDDENRLNAVRVLVINHALADRYFPGQNPIGQHLTSGFFHGGSNPDSAVHPSGEIIGVAGNAYYESLKTRPEPATFLDEAQLRHRRRAAAVGAVAAELGPHGAGAVVRVTTSGR